LKLCGDAEKDVVADFAANPETMSEFMVMPSISKVYSWQPVIDGMVLF
jgi:hypothetical protein